jgi:hypothetical protein
MVDTLKALVPLALALALPFGLLVGASQLLRRVTRARDARLADDLITQNKARWRTDTGKPDGKPMDQADWRRIERAGERRWQETLKAQRRTRKPSDPAHVVEFRDRGRGR